MFIITPGMKRSIDVYTTLAQYLHQFTNKTRYLFFHLVLRLFFQDLPAPIVITSSHVSGRLL